MELISKHRGEQMRTCTVPEITVIKTWGIEMYLMEGPGLYREMRGTTAIAHR